MTYPLMDALYSAIFRISIEELAHVEGLRHGYVGHLIEGRRFDSQLLHSFCAHPNVSELRDQATFHNELGTTRRFLSAEERFLSRDDDMELTWRQRDSASNYGSGSSSPRTGNIRQANRDLVDPLQYDPWPEKRTVQKILAKIEVHAAENQQENWNKARSVVRKNNWPDVGNKAGKVSLVSHVANVQQRKADLENSRKKFKSKSSERLFKGSNLSTAAKSKNDPRYNSDSSLYQANDDLQMFCEPCATEAQDLYEDDEPPDTRHTSINEDTLDKPTNVDSTKVPSIKTLLMMKRAAKRKQLVKASSGYVYNNSAKPYQKATLLWDEGDLPEFGLDLPDGGPTAFQWKGVECLMNGLSGDQLTRQLISLHRVINSKDRHSLAQMVRTVADLDLTLPLRGVTALSLSLFIRQPAITKDLLTHLHRLGQLSRAINMTSVDNTHRRETPLITAARTGQSESVELLLLYKDILDLESKDGEGRTAIWNAVREEHFGIVMQLVENGARIHYDNGDLSCPLQLACKTHLLKARGKQIVRYLVSHGANLEFVDHALRNALYWAIYHSCGETAVFLLKAGIKVKPWLWLGDDALPNSILEDKDNLSLIRTVRSEPRELKILARTVVRNWLISQANSRSIYPRIDSLSLGEKGKALLRLDEILNLKIRSNGTTNTASGTGKKRDNKK